MESHPTDLAAVLAAIARTAARLCEATDALIHLVEGDHHRLVAKHGRLVHFQRLGDTHAVRKDTPLGRSVLDRRAVHVRDVQVAARKRFRGLVQLRLLSPRIRTVLVVPLLSNGEALGGIVIRRTHVQPFTTKQIALLRAFADQAAIAIENARLFTELQARNQALAEALEQQTATSAILRAISRSPTDVEPVLDEIAEHAARLCDALFAAVYRFDGELIRVGALHNYPPAALERSRQFFPAPPTRRFFTGRALLDRAVVHVPDTAQDSEFVQDFLREADFRSVLCVPMLRDGNPVGAITVWRASTGSFSDRQISLLQTFADQGIIAIENVRLFSELQARNRALSEALEQQTATAEILRVISEAQTDAQPVFDTIVRSAVRLCNAAIAAVFRIEDGMVHHPANFGGAPATLAAARYPRAVGMDTIPGIVALTQSTVHYPDVEDASVPDHVQQVGRLLDIRSVVGVPMLREGEALGAILVTRQHPGLFADGEVELLKTFADQAVIAIENVRLFGELQQRTAQLGHSVDQLRALSEVGQAVSSTLDLDAVLHAIVSRASQLAGTRGCSIWEYDERAEVFQLRATTIQDAEVADILKSAGLRKGQGAIGRAALTRAPVQIPDVSAAGAYEGPLRDALLRAGGGSVLTLPLLHEDRLLGGLTVSRRATGEFPPDAVALLTAFAAQSSIALQNARLFRELEAKSRELEVASRHKSQFLANMSHELRTPLNAILGYGEMMADGIYGELPGPVREVLGRVDASGRHLLGLINDVLDLSKIEAGQLSLALAEYSMQEVAQVVLVSVEALAAEKGLALAMDVAPDLPTGRGDQRRLTQVLLNLVGNAIKFTEQGSVSVQVTAEGGVFAVSVRDTGPGIAPADQERIFEEFQQADTATTRPKGGTGLGLAIARRIIAMHGGRLWVESVPGEGATFRLTLPVQVERQAVIGTGVAG